MYFFLRKCTQRKENYSQTLSISLFYLILLLKRPESFFKKTLKFSESTQNDIHRKCDGALEIYKLYIGYLSTISIYTILKSIFIESFLKSRKQVSFLILSYY